MIFGFFRNWRRTATPPPSPTFTTTEKPFPDPTEPVKTVTKREETVEVRSRILNKRESREFAAIYDSWYGEKSLSTMLALDQYVLGLIPPSATSTNSVWNHDKINDRIRIDVFDNDRHRDMYRLSSDGRFTHFNNYPDSETITVYVFRTMGIPMTPEIAP